MSPGNHPPPLPDPEPDSRDNPAVTPHSARGIPAPTWRRRALRTLAAIPLALFIFLEEWVWDTVLAATAWLAKLPPVRWLEDRIARLPPYAAVAAFIIPAAVLLPFKLAAFWLIAHGHHMVGLQVFIVAKIVGTALLARIFKLTRDSLLTIGWFARIYFAFTGWKERLYAYVRALPAYQQIRARMIATKAGLKAWWRTHFGPNEALEPHEPHVPHEPHAPHEPHEHGRENDPAPHNRDGK